MEDKSQYSFVQETIKNRPINKRKLFRRTLMTASLAVVFGLIACLTFFLIEPVINKTLNPEQISKVEFPEEKQEVLPGELLTEESVAQQEEEKQEAVMEEARQQAIEEAQQSITAYAFSVAEYEKLYDEFYEIANACNSFLVTVTGITEREDWIIGTMENRKTTSGIIVAENEAEYFILADSSTISTAREYYVTFCDKQMVRAERKQADSQTGLAIFSVSVDAVAQSTQDTITVAELGRSSNVPIIGKPAMAIGAPFGVANSLSYGMITANDSTLNVADAIYRVLLSDMNMGSNASGVIIDLDKKVLGVIAGSVRSIGGSNTLSAIGISEIKSLIARLSNNEERAYIGIKGNTVTNSAHTEIGVPYGAYVTEVVSQSPAMKAGIANGDVIVRIGDQDITSFREYHTAVLALKPQEIVSVTVMRYNGSTYIEMTMELTTSEAK